MMGERIASGGISLRGWHTGERERERVAGEGAGCAGSERKGVRDKGGMKREREREAASEGKDYE